MDDNLVMATKKTPGRRLSLYIDTGQAQVGANVIKVWRGRIVRRLI
jgi:hypothetical protein